MKIRFFLAVSSCFLSVSCTPRDFNSDSEAKNIASWRTVVKCNGLRYEMLGTRDLQRNKQIVINDVDNAFSNLGRMLGQNGQNPDFVKKWDNTELVVEGSAVDWNSEFKSFSKSRLITVDMTDGQAVVKVYKGFIVDEDRRALGSIEELGNHVFKGCQRL